MKVICFSTSEEQAAALRRVAPSQQYPTVSFLLRTIIAEFLDKNKPPAPPAQPAK